MFHELGHVLKHGKKEQFLSMDKSDTNEREKEANDFASEMLLSNKVYEEFLDNYASRIDKEKIMSFSNQHRISPSVLVGRMEHDGIVNYSIFSDIHKRIKVID